MSKNFIKRSPLQSPVNSAEFLRTFTYNRAPLESDYKNFKITDLWIHRNPGGDPEYGYYVLVDKPNQTGVWLDIGGTQEGDIQSISGDTGGSVPPDSNGNINVLGGSGATVVGDPGTNTLNINVTGGGLAWQVDTTSPISLISNTGHIENGGTQIIYNLPTTCAIGDMFSVVASSVNGFQISANAGQTIIFGNQTTTSSGSITSTNQGDVIYLLCIITDTTFVVINSIGNLTVA